jgi:purine-nucleoside phosphorylase
LKKVKTKSYMEKVQEAAHFLACFLELGKTAELACCVILGSGLADFAHSLQDSRQILFSQIPHFPVSSVTGHAGALVWGTLENNQVCCLQGRAHFYEGHSMETVTFPLRVLWLLGLRKLVLTNSAGGLNPGFRPGDLMLLRDHLSLFVPNPLIGENEETFGPRFPDMSQCYSSSLRRIARQCAKQLKLTLKEGVYAAVSGPSYETPAEIRLLRRLGADAVGMSTVPEVIVARHMGIECLGISCITNLAAGISRTPLSHEEVLMAAGKSRPLMDRLLMAVCRKLGREETK